jgi:transposase
MDKQAEKLAIKYPEIGLLRTAPGVGPIVAAAYVLTLDRPEAASNRSAGAFLGLRSGQSQSGDSDPQKRISKTGDRCVRSLLVQSAQRPVFPSLSATSAGCCLSSASGNRNTLRFNRATNVNAVASKQRLGSKWQKQTNLVSG